MRYLRIYLEVMKRENTFIKKFSLMIQALVCAFFVSTSPCLSQISVPENSGSAQASSPKVGSPDLQRVAPVETSQIVGTLQQSSRVVKSPFTISDGTRITVQGKGISLIPPQGWEVHRSYPNTTLLLQPPFKLGMKYQRTIQVMRLSGDVPIDEITGREFEKEIEEKYSKAEGSISDYRMRNHLLTKMADNSPGILYYSEFILQETPLMQAHILVSSSSHKYLLTYTDLAAHFEGDEASDYWTNAWESMISVELDSPASTRLRTPVYLGFAVGFFTLLLLFFLAFRRYKAGRRYEALLDEPYDIETSNIETKDRNTFNLEEEDFISKAEGKSKRKNRRTKDYEIQTQDAELLDEDDDELDDKDGWNLRVDEDSNRKSESKPKKGGGLAS